MIKLTKADGNRSSIQSWQIVIGSVMVLGASFYTSMGLSAETAVIIMGILKALDTGITMWLRTNSTQPMK